jgi:hypothetical protein
MWSSFNSDFIFNSALIKKLENPSPDWSPHVKAVLWSQNRNRRTVTFCLSEKCMSPAPDPVPEPDWDPDTTQNVIKSQKNQK